MRDYTRRRIVLRACAVASLVTILADANNGTRMRMQIIDIYATLTAPTID